MDRPSTAHQANSRDDEQTHLSKRIVYSTDRLCSPPNPKRRSRKLSTAPSSPQLNPQPLVRHPEPAAAAMSPPTFTPGNIPHSSPVARPLPKHPSQPQQACKCAVSLPTAAPNNEHERLQKNGMVLTMPPPAHFDWADDAASLPIAPATQPRDLLVLRTDRQQPFGTLRRRTRRRRAPSHFFSSSRKLFQPALPPHVMSEPFIMRRHPSGIAHGKPIITIPCIAAHLPTSAPNLDWDNDPRLSDLSCALQALGWIPPC